MGIPNKVLFELGFGYKYQYLVSALIYAVISKKINYPKMYRRLKSYVDKNNISGNTKVFFEQINEIIPDKQELKYNVNTLLMLEGEPRFFEDINLFTSNQTSLIRFIQVKGSMAESTRDKLNAYVMNTLINFQNSVNRYTPFQLIILVNAITSPHFLIQTKQDKIKVIVSLLHSLEEIKKLKKTHKDLYVNFFQIIEDYLEELYSEPSKQNLYIYTFFYKACNKRKYTIFAKLLNDLKLFKWILLIKYSLERTKIIHSLDHRLVYLFLKFLYGNDSLKKLLWNIEMKCMSGDESSVQKIKYLLKMISFEEKYIQKLKFSKDGNLKFKIGKML